MLSPPMLGDGQGATLPEAVTEAATETPWTAPETAPGRSPGDRRPPRLFLLRLYLPGVSRRG